MSRILAADSPPRHLRRSGGIAIEFSFVFECLHLDAFSPPLRVRRLQLDEKCPIGLQGLLAGPPYRPADSPGFDFGAQLESAVRHLARKHEACLANPAPIRMTGIETAAHAELSVHAFDGEPQHARYARNAVVADTHNHFAGAIAFALPHPRRPYAVAHALLQRREASRIAFVVAHGLPR